MTDSLWHDEPLSDAEADHPARCAIGSRLEVDQQGTVENEEEFVIVGMLVPVILPFHDAEANDRSVHGTRVWLYHASLTAPTNGSIANFSSG